MAKEFSLYVYPKPLKEMVIVLHMLLGGTQSNLATLNRFTTFLGITQQSRLRALRSSHSLTYLDVPFSLIDLFDVTYSYVDTVLVIDELVYDTCHHQHILPGPHAYLSTLLSYHAVNAKKTSIYITHEKKKDYIDL